MEDPETHPNNDGGGGGSADPSEPGPSEEEDRIRQAEEAMERMLLAQEAEEGSFGGGSGDDDDDDDAGRRNDDHGDADFNHDGGFPAGAAQLQFDGGDDALGVGGAAAGRPDAIHHRGGGGGGGSIKRNPFSYVQVSFYAAAALIYYALRSRQQWYLALVYLSSSKWAYIVLGNALVASLVWTFQLFTGFFLNGLRLAEAEGLGDFFRWNITETCLALTIFRAELTVKTGVLFLIFVLAKCLHWVADTREGHLRMTEEAVVVRPNSRWPALRWSHVKLLACLYLLQLMDVLAVIQCGQDIWQKGASVSILFAFEGAIMLTSVVSNILLWHLHLVDGLVHYLHEKTEPTSPMHRWIHPWKDHKATMIFAVEVQAQATKFFFYVTFFAIVMTYYGLPINLIREVYVSFQALKQRLTAFGKYRQLMASMNRFANPSAEELEEERTCIICRDEMNVETAKRLPGCGHM
jgi:E3 ubiquitin-protein ligase synoviolin